MEKKLTRLLDYQRFEKNARLDALIAQTEERFAKELSEDELTFVNAAGEFGMTGGESPAVSGPTGWAGEGQRGGILIPRGKN